ncbi:DUF2201 family putative metallopeptidase [Halomonas koreensis]|uniref:Putative metallopeptidase domain-containing protein n=1 Tax=Halomonas koreensis TaxID=245385 RepID=A0ABU1G5F2_9GAMM|nr:hypothetical protein [Halomonas koreensis]MDR5868172.1 hypothetical protein [Halomonas koreensis]
MERMTVPSKQECDHGQAFRRQASTLRLWRDDRQAWQEEQPALAFLSAPMPIEAACPTEVRTATTDGERLLVNPAWSATLDETTRRFMQAHLALHCAAGHLRPANALDERRWHLACDHQVNLQLLMLGLKLPPTAVLFPAQIGQPLAQVYDSLAENPLIKNEESLDTPPWTNGLQRGDVPSSSPGFTSRTPLQHHWRQRVFQLVRSHLGEPGLPASVASWLLAQWSR